ALPGVLAVITHDDLPTVPNPVMPTIRGPIPSQWDQDRILARYKVLFRGHPIAAVAATDIHIAEDALELIEVEYEVLPAITSLADALLPNAPLLHEDGLGDLVEDLFPEVEGRKGNIARVVEMGFG